MSRRERALRDFDCSFRGVWQHRHVSKEPKNLKIADDLRRDLAAAAKDDQVAPLAMLDTILRMGLSRWRALRAYAVKKRNGAGHK